MKPPRALLFDIDGTVLDTREFIFQATEHALSVGGYPIPDRSVIAKFVGKPFDEFYHSIASTHDSSALQAAHREFQKKHFNLSVAYPGTHQTLHGLRARGYALAAVTTRSRETSLETLRQAGIADLFNIVISGEDAPEVKPHPAPVLAALRALNEEPSAAVMVGDSYVDVEAGKRADTKTVRVTYGFHTERLHEPEPDYIVGDIIDLLTLF